MEDCDALALLSAYHEAMVAGDTEALNQLVAPDFSLVHITGYVQPKAEWFEVIRTRQFEYHSISVDQGSLRINGDGDFVAVKGRGIFDATIQGMHRPWRLGFKISMSRSQGRATINHAAYTAS
jgi:hypothetical protein